MSDWCILRTAGRLTLRLANSLAKTGFDVWTPVETRTLRVPRANVRRSIVLPIMPSYVFARSAHLVDLIELASAPAKPGHGDFSVMHHHDTIPLIRDAELQGLRGIEARRNPRQKAPKFPRGITVRVKIEGGSFAGMHGRVEQSDGANTLVCFSGRLTVKIPTSLLQSDQLSVRVSQVGTAARKAA